jgi:hypothetical protein
MTFCEKCFDVVHVELLNILLKEDKNFKGPKGPHLGFWADVNTLEIFLTEERRLKLLAFIESLLRAQVCEKKDLEKLAGRLSHFAHKVFNRSARAFLYPIYNHGDQAFTQPTPTVSRSVSRVY